MGNKVNISVITVVFNDKEGLEKTIQSVLSQTYNSMEYIVIDGGSTDGTVDIIRKYESHIDRWISESDDGIYDAMNKGIKMATGDWLNFMNAGDMFADNDVLKNVFSYNIPKEASFLYSDFWQSEADGYYYLKTTNRSLGSVHHQASIYKKKLHNDHGLYITQKPYSVYDLLFFLSIPKQHFCKVPYIIAMFDGTGLTGQASWVWEKAEAARVVFGFKSLRAAFFEYMRRVIREKIPKPVRRIYGKYVFMRSPRVRIPIK